MRTFLNAILAAIGTASLSDEEFSSLTIQSAGNDVATYDALLTVLDSRELVSQTRDRLYHYFLSRGVEVTLSSSGRSNILAGSDL